MCIGYSRGISYNEPTAGVLCWPWSVVKRCRSQGFEFLMRARAHCVLARKRAVNAKLCRDRQPLVRFHLSRRRSSKTVYKSDTRTLRELAVGRTAGIYGQSPSWRLIARDFRSLIGQGPLILEGGRVLPTAVAWCCHVRARVLDCCMSNALCRPGLKGITGL